MKLSQTFVKTTKTTPGDEKSESAKLLLRAGYIYKEMAGVYDFLPLGMKVLDNIMQVIREEMNAIGGQELKMTSLQLKDAWEASGSGLRLSLMLVAKLVSAAPRNGTIAQAMPMVVCSNARLYSSST